MAHIYFCMVTKKFGAIYHGRVVILDLAINEYISLDDKTSLYLSFILQNKFIFERGQYSVYHIGHNNDSSISNQELDQFICYFLQNNIIEICQYSATRKILVGAQNPIGLNQADWLAPQRSVYPKLSAWGIFEALVVLAKVHSLLNKDNLENLFNFLSTYRQKKAILQPPSKLEEIDKVVCLLEKACMWYPKKTLCLAWACTFAILCLKKSWSCDLLIGIQNHPFYAHAWIEINHQIVNDNPQLKERLAPIMQLTFA